MTKIRCFLIDDEPPAITLLEKHFSRIDQFEVVGTSNSALKALDLLKEVEIDLLFLDIRMPVLNGIEFIETLKNPPSVILCTAYREYPIEAYDLDVIDYLLKPISFSRFLKAVRRYEERRATPSPAPSKVQVEKVSDHIFFNINRTHHKVILSDILYIESLKDYVRIHLKEDRLVVKGNIGSVMKRLPENRFVRIHRSYAISLAFIESYSQSEVNIKGTMLPVGSSYREGLVDRLGGDSA